MDEKDQAFDDDELDFEDDILEEDSWDDFDDEMPMDAENAPPEIPDAQNKSFLSKHFNKIVIAIAVLGAGGWFLAKMSSAPSVSDNANPAQQINSVNEQPALTKEPDVPEALSNSDDLPPMPSPINDIEDRPYDQTIADILTPMPAAPIVQDLAQAEESASPAQEMPEQIEKTDAAPVEEVPAPIRAKQAVANDAAREIKPPLEKEESAQPQPPQEMVESLNAFENRLSAIEDNNTQLSQQLSETTQALAAINVSIKSIQSSLATLSANKKATAEVKQEPAPKIVPKVEAVPTPKLKSKAPAQKIEWHLRSAQPGKAILASKQSSDIRSVQVGDTVNGLGVIKSIGVEDGRWVVKGTKGMVTQ